MLPRTPSLVVWLLFLAVTSQFCRAQSPPFFNVRDYGAAGDGSKLDSPAVNAAIAAAGAAGGGTVTFPAGTYLCGSIHLTNNLCLYLSNSAAIWASATNIDVHESNSFFQYQDEGHSYFHDSMIWGENLTNLSFLGPGKIDGHGGLTTGNPSTAVPGDKALCLVLCTNITIAGITITNGGHFGILAQACEQMLMTNANVWEKTSRDGFNLISSSFVVISNCSIEGSDDSMCLKSTYALGRTIASQNIHISHCQILSTENNATQFGSETVGPFSDVTFSDLVLTGAGKAGIGITSQDGSIIDGVTYDNIIMSNCACPIFLKLDLRTTDTPAPSVGAIRNISINNVSAYHSTLFSRTNTSTINGYSDGGSTVVPVQNITFNNVSVSNIGRNPATAITNAPVETQDWQPNTLARWPSYGWYLRWADNISFTNCQAHFDNNDDRPAVVVDDSTNVLFNGFVADVGINDTNYDMGFVDATMNYGVLNATASANSPSPGSALRLSSSNSASGLVVSPPYFAPGDGIYTSTQSVAIVSGTPGATIHYTTDGTTPTASSGVLYSGQVSISSETVLRAAASVNGMVSSAVNTAIYTFVSLSPAAPSFNPPGGTYAGPQSVTITSTTPGTSIFYSVNGGNDTGYSGPVMVGSNVLLRAVAEDSNLVSSPVSAASYTISGVAATPTFSPPSAIYSNAPLVSISSATADASIRYTTDGSDPSETTGTLYSSPILVSSAAMFKAIAYASNASDSAISEAVYSSTTPLLYEAESIPLITSGGTAVVQTDANSSGGKWMALETTSTNGPYIQYTLANVPAGTYQLNLKYKGNTERGIITHSVDGVPLGDVLDQYSANQTYPYIGLRVFTFANAGAHTVRQTVIGQNPANTSQPWASADRFDLLLVQPPQPVIATPATLSNGTIQLTGSGYPSLSYVVQATTNVVGGIWTNIGTATADVNGVLQFIDANDSGLPMRFYRFLAP